MKLNELGEELANIELSAEGSTCTDVAMPKYPTEQTFFYIAGYRKITDKGYDLYLGKIRTSSLNPIWIVSYGSNQDDMVG